MNILPFFMFQLIPYLAKWPQDGFEMNTSDSPENVIIVWLLTAAEHLTSSFLLLNICSCIDILLSNLQFDTMGENGHPVKHLASRIVPGQVCAKWPPDLSFG